MTSTQHTPTRKKISVTLTIEVDPAAWEMTYGEFSREDVKSYVESQIWGSAATDEGCITAVTPK